MKFKDYVVGSEVLIAEVMTTICDITPCSPSRRSIPENRALRLYCDEKPGSRNSGIGSEADFLGNELLRQLYDNSWLIPR
jgi:hypothetical protein